MTDKSPHPLAPSNGINARSDAEAVSSQNSKELRRKKRIKWLLYIVAFAVFQTGVILLFVLTVMKLRTPKFRVRSATFEVLDANQTASFDWRMTAQLGVKNTNFGEYKYKNSTIQFFYKNNLVGEASIRKSNAGWRTTKKFNVDVNLSSSKLPQNSNLATDLNKGLLPLTSQSKLEGKVELMKIFKKKKATEMNCEMQVDIARRVLSNIVCK